MPPNEIGNRSSLSASESYPKRKLNIGIVTTKELDPPRDGRADNVWKLVRLLSEEPKVRVVLLSLSPQTPRVTSQFETVTVPWKLGTVDFWKAIGRGLPIQVAFYENTELIRRLARGVAPLELDVIVADMARTSRIVLKLPARQRILAMDDRLSARYRRQADVVRSRAGFGQVPSWFPSKFVGLARRFEWPILMYESKRLRGFEERICKFFDAVVLVSQDEAEGLRAQTGAEVLAIPNFVELPNIPVPTARDPATILYFGNMSTAHNIDAAAYLAREVFPLIKLRLPDSQLSLVGRNISSLVKNLQDLESVSVCPDAKDVTPFLGRSTVGVFPIRFGSGIKTKILEALHSRLPVVTTPIGAEGIPEASSCMVIRERPQDLADAAVDIMIGRHEVRGMVEAGVRMVDRFYSRETVRDKWLTLLGRIAE